MFLFQEKGEIFWTFLPLKMVFKSAILVTLHYTHNRLYPAWLHVCSSGYLLIHTLVH